MANVDYITIALHSHAQPALIKYLVITCYSMGRLFECCQFHIQW